MITVKKYPMLLMSFLIVGMIIFCVPHHAQATELDNIIDGVQILDRDGKPIDSESDSDRVVDSQEDIVVVYNWSIKDNQPVHAGDTVHIQIPKEFKIYTTVQGELVISDGGASCGEFEITTDGMMTITFNDYVENHSISHGIVEVYTNFDLEELDGETPTTIVFPISENDSEEFTIKIKPDTTNAFEKKGSTVQNAQVIDWEIKINQELATHENASVEDFPGNGQKILFDSFEVHEMNMHIDGTYEIGAKVDPSEYTVTKINNTSGQTGFRLTFENPIDSAYQITYQTEITDFNKATFSNTATFNSDETEEVMDSDVVIPRDPIIQKYPLLFDTTSNKISWKVEYNQGHYALDNSVMVDTYIDEQSFGGITRIVNGDTGIPLLPTEYTVTDMGSAGFKIELPDDGYYTIYFETIVPEGTTGMISNTASIISPNIPDNEAEGDYFIPDPSPTEGLIDKKIENFNAKTGELTWEIIINKDGGTLHNPVITDEFPDGGLIFHPATLKIMDSEQVKLDSADYEVVPLNGDSSWEKGFQINFNRDITGQHVITYKTQVNPSTHTSGDNEYTNNATIKTDTAEASDSDTKWIDKVIDADGYKNGVFNYKTGEIEWKLIFNDSSKLISKPTIEDSLNSGQTFIQDSIEIHKIDLSATPQVGELIPPENYDVTFTKKENGNEQMLITFKKPLIHPVEVTYKTKPVGITKPLYKNKAVISDGEEVLADYEAEVIDDNANKYVNKSGEQVGDNIDWEIYANQSGSTVSNATVTDTLGTGQKLDTSSIKVYKAQTSVTGKMLQESNMPISPAEYDLKTGVDEESNLEYFQVKFKNEINQSYVIKYQTAITLTSDTETTAQIGNSVTFTGDNITKGETEKTKNIEVKITTGDGTGTGETGKIILNKVDKADPSIPLEGATFDLYANDEKVDTQTTNKNGVIEFDDLVYGDYTLKEVSAPEGYTLPTASTENIQVKLEQDEKVVQVMNEKMPIKETGEVHLVKTDKATGATLAGAEFSLYDKSGAELQNGLTTDENGEIRVQNLEPGDYAFQETEAPTNYDLATNTWPFTIVAEQTSATMVTAENNKTGKPDVDTGEVILVKQDSATGETLEGAVFDLMTADGAIVASNLTTDANGEITVTNLAPGKYSFKETKAPEGYELATDVWEFTIAPNQPEKITITAENTKLAPIPDAGSVKIIKQDSENGVRLAGAEFSLIAENGETLQTNLKTDEAGELEVNNLAPGNYRIQETKAPDGYQLESTPWQFEIVANDTSQVTVIAENAKLEPDISETGAVRLIKTDSETGTRLSGAVFSLLDESGKVIQANLTTDENGEIFIDGLTPGNYSLKETKAPDGYELAEQPWNFQIVKGQVDAVIIKAENSPIIANGAISFEGDETDKPESIEIPVRKTDTLATEVTKLPQTGDKTSFPRVILGGSAVLMSLLYLRKKSS
ncbi:collagen binding domain-containing protein [Listeria monocytogenes]|nr:collagen binding domain-containing protein [Listeria monocytogenes]